MFKAVRSPKAWNVLLNSYPFHGCYAKRSRSYLSQFHSLGLGRLDLSTHSRSMQEWSSPPHPRWCIPKKPQENLHWFMDASQSSRSFSIQSRSVLGWDGYGHQLQGKIRHELLMLTLRSDFKIGFQKQKTSTHRANWEPIMVDLKFSKNPDSWSQSDDFDLEPT